MSKRKSVDEKIGNLLLSEISKVDLLFSMYTEYSEKPEMEKRIIEAIVIYNSLRERNLIPENSDVEDYKSAFPNIKMIPLMEV